MILDIARRHYGLIKYGDWPELWMVSRRIFLFGFGLLPALAFLICIRLLQPIVLVRINRLVSTRIGHFTVNTELYLCEREAGENIPEQRHIDIHFHGGNRISNKQLALMWERRLRIWPKWLLEPVFIINRIIPGGAKHELSGDFQSGRDVCDLFNRIPAQLTFTGEEALRGKNGLNDLGIPLDAEFICLIVRDSSYLNKVLPRKDQWDYHNYRDSDINNYVLAAEELAERGYYVVRMGEIVNAPINSTHPKVIDYATNGMRSDFMDIYLGAKCLFCISVGTGFDGVPSIFRRPIVYVNQVPIGYVESSRKHSVILSKRYFLRTEQTWLTLKEIFSNDIGFSAWSDDYESKNIALVENTPEEIKDAVIEMLERIKGVWNEDENDECLQQRFWKIFPTDARCEATNRPLHGKIRARYSAQFLRDNSEWLQ